MRLKRWESPRRQGRNHKGKGGSARKRQLKKQQQMLRHRLKTDKETNKNNNQGTGEENFSFPLFLGFFRMIKNKAVSFTLPSDSYFTSTVLVIK
ncbi:hypothetical protein [Fischerella thermalis]|uniref:hypothetical protein n=1 Tax=Fischerella thermalis TaxID=372787 RepID=UPI000CA79956|nr:hypothetical protein [Fischerella thermalis]PLZ06067.1 hypothetical protein CBP18_19415 [Fischerella thermalis WC119]RDH47010.1 hypothetical protein CA946_22715 [Fischerella thermalis 111/344/542]RDH47742.1 hypothetical protein CBF18_21390 [Mastigocladus laminosus WC112]